MNPLVEYPVLIGSRALACYGYDGVVRDWDIIMTEDYNYQLRKQQRSWCFYGFDSSFTVKGLGRVDACKVEGAKKLVYDFCNVLFEKGSLKFIDHPYLGKIIVAPLELLYALKKAHIHRVLEHHSSSLENVKTWRKQVFQYLWMREKLDYKRMDALIYHPDGDLRTNQKKHSESELDYLTRRVFAAEFDAVTKRVGDTKISMDKTEEEFFTDGVNRFIDHDELHRKVAQMCRQTDELLFKKFMTSDESVEMDRELFLAADRTVQIQTIREEIIVLLLERKLIPTMVRNRDLGICYNGLDMKRRIDEMHIVIAHFMTNLCGQGHHWLRRWCIDHYKFFDKDIEALQDLYPHKEIDQIAVEISRIQDLGEKMVQENNISLMDFIIRGPRLRIEKEKWGTRKIRSTDLNLSSEIVDKIKYEQIRNMGEGENAVKFRCIDLDNVENVYGKTLVYRFINTAVMTLVLRRMTSSKTRYVYRVNSVIYDPFSNIGITHENNKVTGLFRVSNIIEGDELAVHIEQISMDDPRIAIHDKTWKKHSFNYYYESAPLLTDSGEDLCPGQSGAQIEFERSYLSTYGTMPWELNSLFETLVRHHLKCLRDQKRLKRYATIDDQWVECDDPDAWTDSSASSDDSY